MRTYATLSVACFVVALFVGGFGYALLPINAPVAYLVLFIAANCAFLCFMFARTATRIATRARMSFISY